MHPFLPLVLGGAAVLGLVGFLFENDDKKPLQVSPKNVTSKEDDLQPLPPAPEALLEIIEDETTEKE